MTLIPCVSSLARVAVDRIQKWAQATKTTQNAKQPFQEGSVQGKVLPVH